MGKQDNISLRKDEMLDQLAFERALSYRSGSKFKGEKATRISKYRKKQRRRKLLIPIVVLLVLFGLYLSVLFPFIPFVEKWRDIWIETAMTTQSHHWLAEYFFPQSIIDDVMGGGLKMKVDGQTGGMSALMGNGSSSHSVTIENESNNTDILGQKNLNVGDKDYAGNTILVNDLDEGLIISEIIGDGFRGQIMLIDDPSRVFVGTTTQKDVMGMRILDMMDSYGAIAGVNGSGFNDAGGEGNGGVVVGMSCSEGNYWGNFLYGYSSIVMTTDNHLVVGDLNEWSTYGNIRDGVQFYPVLIADGKKQVSGSSGYGLQPRTAVAQREDGVMAFLIIDGRQVGWSLGCTVGDMADILLSYNMVNASCCDGGASSCLAYDGQITTKNCSYNPSVGRILPNAFLVRSKKK